MTKLETFLAHKPTVLAKFGGFTVYEHPLRGDEAPMYMATPEGKLVNTGFYDLGDFDLALCFELAGQ